MSTDPRYINTIHEIGCMKFHVLYCTQEQLHVFNEYCRVLGTSSAISIDASGRFAQAFEICPGRMTGHIFLYTVTIRFEGKTICVHQMLTEIHTQEFIELWLKYWVRLGAKAPGESWSDYERGIPMSSCLTFNGKSLKDYIDDVFEWARTTDKKNSRPANTLIRIDVAHLMALVARWKCLKHKDHPYIKNFFVRCVALMVDTQSIEEFQQIFLLTCIVALQPYEDNFVSTSTIKMTVLDARKELEGHMSVRERIICDIEASITSYLEEKGNTSKPFEEGENGTRTHQWIKKLIASVTPSDMSGNSVNAFYLPDFVKELTRIAKEFPLWTAAAIPVAGKHASTAHQEGYFAILQNKVFEHIRLPCPGNRFVLEHLHSLNSGSNLLAAKLKHFNHQRELLSTPTLKDETVEENENSHPKPPPKRNHLIDDTDLFSYEKWRGLKNKQLFIVESESSEPIMKDNLDAKKDESPIHNTTILSEILNYEDTQINNFADDSTKNNEDQNLKFINDNSMVNEKADYEVVGDEVLNIEGNDFDIPLDYLEKNPKINSHIPYTPKRDPSNFFCTSQVYTSTPLLDHSYAKLISSSADILLEDIGSLDEERDSSTNGEGQRNPKTTENFDIHSKNPTLNAEAVTNTFIAEKRRLKPENQEKGNNDQNLIAPHPKHILCNEEIVRKNVGKVKNSGKHEIEGKKMISKGFYFQPYPEIKLLNERKTSRKKGFLLPNGLICSLIQIKNAQYPWNFNNEKFKNMPIQRNGIKVFVKNTCGFDSLVHIVQFSALDNPTYHSYIENSANTTLQLIFNFMKTGLTSQILLDRLKILNQFHTIAKDPNSTSLSPYFLDAETFITRTWSNFLDSEPSGFITYQCSNKDCIGKEIQKISFLSINENVIRQNGYQALQDALLYYPQIFNIKCLQPGCTETLTKKTDLNIHICIELDVRDYAARERSIECSLHDFPISLNLEQKYRLAGVIHYISKHFIAYCLRASGSWICCDDLKGRIDGVKTKTAIVNPHAVIYVLE
ncbi:uncharacterized protein [Temnothorax nylanderi]|uniref:uncharacterized protein isoform X1 n=1 Tax=Temnothorax nylanderi TaxID=102681 RepID=UPI003A875D77